MKETDHKREMMRLFDAAKKGRSAYETWQAYIYLAAHDVATASGCDTSPFDDMFETMRKTFADSLEEFSLMFAEMTAEYEDDPYQDLLGKIYMELGIGNEAGGQFFTPFQASELSCRLIYRQSVTDAQLERRGYVTMHEPSAGSGGMVVAMAKMLHDRGINYQERMLAHCIEISEITALMCYVQLSMVGVAAVVSVGDTLTLDLRYHLRTPVLAWGSVWVARSMKGNIWEETER